MDKFGINANDNDFKQSIFKACLKVRVANVYFCVPFGQVELFLKMALSCKNDIEIIASENSDIFLI